MLRRRMCAPSPALSGGGWGGGASAKRAGRGDRLSPTRHALASAIAEAQLRRFPRGRDESSWAGDGSALPLPLFAGEGWGGGASAKRAGRGDRLSPTRRALASASTSPASGRGKRTRCWTDSINKHPALAGRMTINTSSGPCAGPSVSAIALIAAPRPLVGAS